ncbi:MAG: glucose-1-phosphate adenylyltransferase [Candidatus Competibacterales bacterium]
MTMRRDPRFISRLTQGTLALILAGGRGSRLFELTQWRAKPGVPFGGKFRIIDFPISNCINSGIRRIGVLTQYKAHSLIQHLVHGWGAFNPHLGEFVEIMPASQRTSEAWYAGTADAIYQNLDIIRTHTPDYVLVLAGDHVYKMDYGPLLAYHVERRADMTVSCLEVPRFEARAFGVMDVDDDGRVVGFAEKPKDPPAMPGRPERALASMGNYVFSTKFLFEQLIQDADLPTSSHDFGKDIIPTIIHRHRVYAYPFRDEATGQQAYWRDVGTLDAFWEANLEMVNERPALDLHDRSWPILTYQSQLPSAKFVSAAGRPGLAINASVAGGCVITGATVRHSLLFSSVKVQPEAELVDAVVLPEVTIGRGAVVRKAIVDRGCEVPPGMAIGVDSAADRQRFRVTEQGVTLVTPGMLGQSLHTVR